MKIVCTVINDLSHDQRMHRICSTLAGAGHEVTLVGRVLPTSLPLPALPYRTYRITCRYHRGKAFYAEYNYRLWQTLRKWEFDVLCSVDLDTLVAGNLLRAAGRKWVFDAHEWFSETPEVIGRPRVRAFWRSVGRRLAPRCDARYTVGKSIARKMEEEYGCSFEVIRNLPLKSSRPSQEVIGGVILYQGMLNPGRGLDCIVEALVSLPRNTLWIAGDGPEREFLEILTRQRGVADRVKFFGHVAPRDLPCLTAAAWLGINLLDGSSPSYYYSLANKALDYLQAGLPSIQMYFPEYRRIHERYDCFELLPVLDSERLVKLIQDLNANPLRYSQLVANCKEAGRELCWENEAPKLLGIYDGL